MKDEDKDPYIQAIMHKTNLLSAGELLAKPIEFLKGQAEKFSPGIIEANSMEENKVGVNHWDGFKWEIVPYPD